MSEEVELMLLADVRSLESEVGRTAKRLAEATQRAESAELGCDIAYKREPTQAEGDAHEYEQHESMGPVRKTGECFVSMGGWTGNRCRLCSRWVWGGPTACERCVAREERDALREELARLHRLAPTGTYTVSLPHEQEIQRLQSQLEKESAERHNALIKAEAHERDWYAAKSEFGTAMAKMREALRAAEKRELQALAELNEREADVKTLQTHIEVQREALQKTSKAVAKLVVPVTKIEELLTENGCDCECEHCWEDHDEDCERCLACRISMAIQKEENHD